MNTLLLAVLLALAAPSQRPAPSPPPTPPVPETWPSRADDMVAEYVEYRCVPELGHITISDGIVRGRKPVQYLRSHAKELAARGIFPCTDERRRRSYRRTDEMAGHKFETLVVIMPPADEESDWTRRVTVLVDGRKKLDCSVGDSPDGEVFVYGVTIFPEDGTIEVAAIDADGQEVYPPRELELIDNPGIITDDTLQPDEGGAEDIPKPLEKA